MTTLPPPDWPLTYRQETMAVIVRCLRAGESCAVVGIGSVGKSNLVRFLLRDDVLAHYLDVEAKSYIFAHVDANKLLERSEWGLWELVLHQLGVALRQHEGDLKVIEEVESLHERAATPSTRYLALRYLDRAVAFVCGQLGLRLVFLVDELDSVCRSLIRRSLPPCAPCATITSTA